MIAKADLPDDIDLTDDEIFHRTTQIEYVTDYRKTRLPWETDPKVISSSYFYFNGFNTVSNVSDTHELLSNFDYQSIGDAWYYNDTDMFYNNQNHGWYNFKIKLGEYTYQNHTYHSNEIIKTLQSAFEDVDIYDGLPFSPYQNKYLKTTDISKLKSSELSCIDSTPYLFKLGLEQLCYQPKDELKCFDDYSNIKWIDNDSNSSNILPWERDEMRRGIGLWV